MGCWTNTGRGAKGKSVSGMICPGNALSYWPLALEKQHDGRAEGMRAEPIGSVGSN